MLTIWLHFVLMSQVMVAVVVVVVVVVRTG